MLSFHLLSHTYITYYIKSFLRHTLDYDPNTLSYLAILDHERYLSNDYSNYIEEQCLINFTLIENVLYLFCDAFFQSTLVLQFDESSPKFNFTSVRSKNTSNTNNITYIHVHLELNILHKISELLKGLDK